MSKQSIHILSSILLLFLTFLFVTGCGDSAPVKAVRSELSLIQQMDEETLQTLIPFKDMVHAQSSLDVDDTEAAETIKLFFKNFTYKIRSSSVEDNHAAVTVDIQNIDAKALAQDLCKALIAQDASQIKVNQNSNDSVSYFALLKKFLTEKSYALVTTTAVITLENTEDRWVLENSEKLEDSLVSGFVSYLKDPDLLSPEQVLTIYMDEFKNLTAKDWVSYLGMEDIFSTNNKIYPQIDLALAEQVTKFFDYKLKKTELDGDTATVTMDLTSLDLDSTLAHYVSLLMEYADTTASIRASDLELSDKTAEYLLKSINENVKTVTKEIEITLVNNGVTWVMQLDDSFTEALLGDITAAVEGFNEVGAGEPLD